MLNRDINVETFILGYELVQGLFCCDLSKLFSFTRSTNRYWRNIRRCSGILSSSEILNNNTSSSGQLKAP